LDLRFEDGVNLNVDFVRFDDVGKYNRKPNPFIITSKNLIKGDSINLIAIRFHPDSLRTLIHFMDSLDTKIDKPQPNAILFRIRYRIDGETNQYYVQNFKPSTAFFDVVERMIADMSEEYVLEKYNDFLIQGRLRGGVLSDPPPQPVPWKY
jgi:hypothetical protein